MRVPLAWAVPTQRASCPGFPKRKDLLEEQQGHSDTPQQWRASPHTSFLSLWWLICSCCRKRHTICLESAAGKRGTYLSRRIISPAHRPPRTSVTTTPRAYVGQQKIIVSTAQRSYFTNSRGEPLKAKPSVQGGPANAEQTRTAGSRDHCRAEPPVMGCFSSAIRKSDASRRASAGLEPGRPWLVLL